MGFSQQQIFDEMKRTGVVPLFTHDNADDAQQVVKAAYDGGIRVLNLRTEGRTRSRYSRTFCKIVVISQSLCLGSGR